MNCIVIAAPPRNESDILATLDQLIGNEAIRDEITAGHVGSSAEVEKQFPGDKELAIALLVLGAKYPSYVARVATYSQNPLTLDDDCEAGFASNTIKAVVREAVTRTYRTDALPGGIPVRITMEDIGFHN